MCRRRQSVHVDTHEQNTIRSRRVTAWRRSRASWCAAASASRGTLLSRGETMDKVRSASCGSIGPRPERVRAGQAPPLSIRLPAEPRPSHPDEQRVTYSCISVPGMSLGCPIMIRPVPARLSGRPHSGQLALTTSGPCGPWRSTDIGRLTAQRGQQRLVLGNMAHHPKPDRKPASFSMRRRDRKSEPRSAHCHRRQFGYLSFTDDGTLTSLQRAWVCPDLVLPRRSLFGS